MPDPIRWGILSTGAIAHKFAKGLAHVPDAELLAVGSRARDTADAFGEEHNVPRRYASYGDLVHDKDVDVVYVGTPHAFHQDNCLLALEAGKPVLCEKPFMMNATQAKMVISYARKRGLFVMEAMWTRFFPLMVRLRKLLGEGLIGEVRLLEANIGKRIPFDPEDRLFDPKLGASALLDMGVYPVSLASMLWGAPLNVEAQAVMGGTGIDEQITMLLQYANGQQANLSATMHAYAPAEATLIGTEGRIRIHRHWYRPDRFSISRMNRENDDEAVEMHEGNGMQFEAMEVHRCLRDGRPESDIMPLDETLAVMHTLDRVRSRIGLRYTALGE